MADGPFVYECIDQRRETVSATNLVHVITKQSRGIKLIARGKARQGNQSIWKHSQNLFSSTLQ